jgi:hypothetical protein
MSRVDILFLSWNRRAFTAAALDALTKNTEWALVGSLTMIDDCSTDGTWDLVRDRSDGAASLFAYQTPGHVGSPVELMNRYLNLCDKTARVRHACEWPEPHDIRRSDIFVKLDNDVIVPPGWLGDALELMDKHPEVDLLGIEPGVGPRPELTRSARSIVPRDRRGIIRAEFIGGIGLMRRRAFEGRERPPAAGRFGFGHWQERNPDLVKAWIAPGLQLFLLNRLPIEPWVTLSRDYVAKGWQRDWPEPYSGIDDYRMWEWWTP